MSTLLRRDPRTMFPDLVEWFEEPFLTLRPYLASRLGSRTSSKAATTWQRARRGGGHAGEGTPVDGRGRNRPHLRPQRLSARPRRIAPLRRPAQGDPGQVPLVADSHGRARALTRPGRGSVAVWTATEWRSPTDPSDLDGLVHCDDLALRVQC